MPAGAALIAEFLSGQVVAIGWTETGDGLAPQSRRSSKRMNGASRIFPVSGTS
jgi:hypothetical protein